MAAPLTGGKAPGACRGDDLPASGPPLALSCSEHYMETLLAIARLLTQAAQM
jgi:hypothetical protein